MTQLAAIEHTLDPFPVYAELRENDPVHYDPQRGSWNVFRYDDVQQVLSDYSIFSSEFSRGASPDQPFAAAMISTDPPRHRQLRNLVTQAFTPRAVEALAPRIKSIVDEHLDRVKGSGKMDVIHDLGYPLPVIVIAELLGVPAEDREQFKQWSDYIVSAAAMGADVDYDKFMGGPVMEMAAYFFNMIEKRQVEPGDDLISGLLRARIDGEGLSTIELLGFCSLLLVAGNETTTNLIGNALKIFTENPGSWEDLRANPDLLPSAIEEVLRYRSPVQSMFRVAKNGTELEGKQIPAGATVMAWIGSANHDETQFPEAGRFDIRRNPNRHLAFGQGIHYCLGAPLARLEAKIALAEMLTRFKSVRRDLDAPIDRLPSLIVYGVRSLPIEFEEAQIGQHRNRAPGGHHPG